MVESCGYRYEDVASHPLALLLPYSVHSYGLVQVPPCIIHACLDAL